MAVVLKKDPAFSLVVPSKVQSYLMAKKPIIASLDGAGANLINELEVGVVSPSEDVSELAKNIKRLISISSEERFEMGERAYDAYAKYFKQEKVIKRIEELLQEVVNG